MSDAADIPCRLCLVTPPDYESVAFARKLADAVAAGDIASVIITAPLARPEEFQKAAEALVPVAMTRGAAALIHNDTRICQRVKADGVHIDGGIADLRAARESLGERKIVGSGGLRSRHEALEAGETNPDYIFFGRLDGDTAPGIFPAALDLAGWWSSVTVIPAIVMGGAAIASVEEARAAGVGFVALSGAIWDDPRGPGTAVAEALERLAAPREAAA